MSLFAEATTLSKEEKRKIIWLTWEKQVRNRSMSEMLRSSAFRDPLNPRSMGALWFLHQPDCSAALF